ncbi:MAG: hypothetical protein JNK24_03715 [Alphaproteobacteria bacterium]|nr:hypothetical protein [Alphaproteobacteria bacterium]
MKSSINSSNLNIQRLSDRIFFALELAVEQKSVAIADELVNALELSMTRNSGGGEFVERRDYPPEIESVLKKLRELKDKGYR